ncbi:phosphotransferase family protein [Novosphingobium colocasiae]|uniref:phosphotransferase family protein n=1 Tax=Novosphingobium colocasiae TaxID=1256513 RepID=UPI0035B388CD
MIVAQASGDPRTAPDIAFIEAMRARYSVEPEIDVVLTAKLKARSKPPYAPVPLESLAAATADLVRSEVGPNATVENPRWLGGGASKIQMAFDLDWTPPGSTERESTPMVLRMEPSASIVETSRRREFEALKLAREYVPVPRCYWVDPEGKYLPYPGLVYGFAKGVTKPSARPAQQVTGIGTNFGPELRPKLALQFVRDLARIHSIPPKKQAELRYFEPAVAGENTALIRQIDWWRRVWDEDRPEAVPLVDVAASWLRANAPVLDRPSLVHGDFRAGNFLYSENTGEVTAWLDWELAVLGDRHQDLAWMTGPHFGHFAEDGKTFLACGLLPADELYSLYEEESGLSVDPERLRYFRVFNDFMSCVHMLASAPRVARHGKTHQDVLVAWLSIIGNVVASGLRETLAEVL